MCMAFRKQQCWGSGRELGKGRKGDRRKGREEKGTRGEAREGKGE